MAIIDFPRKLIFILLQLITIVFAEQLYQQCLLQIGNYSANSTYQANLNGVLSSLVSENTEFNYGFYNFSAGESPEKATAVALCRGDVKPDDCRSCLNDSIHKLSESCPFQKEAIAWYDSCMLRYSNRSIIGIAEDQPAFYMWNVNNATDPKEFNRVLGDLLGSLRSRAASGGSLQKFATGDTVYTVFQRIYALVQCTPDLTELDCNDCLVQAFADIPICCDNKLGGRVIGPSCNFRYEVYRFYEPAAPDVPSPSPTPALVPPPVSSPQPNDTPTTRDAEMNAKISDFGMARLFSLDQSQAETSRIVGTYGYMAPEYAMHGNFSVKSDVFSFGVLVLEIVSGHKNSSFHNGENIEDLLSYAWKSWKEGTAQNLVDPTVRSGSRTEMMRCIHIGLLCVQENLADRPTMASVVLMLNSCSVTLPVPSQPAFFMHSNRKIDKSSTEVYGSESNQTNIRSIEYSENEVSITELYPR